MHPVILLLLSSISTDWVWLLIFTRFLDHTQWRNTVGRTPMNEWSVRRRDLYLTTQQSQQTNIHAPRCAEDFYLSLKIRRLRPGLNPRTWVPKASTLSLDHRCRSLAISGFTFELNSKKNKFKCCWRGMWMEYLLPLSLNSGYMASGWH